MTLDRGVILLIPFPFTDLSTTKRRPVVALTAHDSYGDFIAMPVTSRSHHEHSVLISAGDLVGGDLPATSWIRTDRVVTLNASLVIKSIARLREAAVQVAVHRLCWQLSLSGLHD